MHLLKWAYQPEHRSNSWRATIVEQRLRIRDLLADSPSLRSYLATEVDHCYGNACQLAAAETGLTLETFPSTTPFSRSDILADAFFPDVN